VPVHRARQRAADRTFRLFRRNQIAVAERDGKTPPAHLRNPRREQSETPKTVAREYWGPSHRHTITKTLLAEQIRPQRQHPLDDAKVKRRYRQTLPPRRADVNRCDVRITGSSARADRLAANVASGMIFRTGGIRRFIRGRNPVPAASTRYTRFEILGECIDAIRVLTRPSNIAQRHHVWGRPTAHDRVGWVSNDTPASADPPPRAPAPARFALAAR